MARKGRIRKRETSSCCEPALFFDETSPWVKPAQGGGRGEEGGKRDRHKVGLLVGRRVSSRSLTGRRGQEGVFFHTLVVSRDTGREALVHQCGRRTGTGEETRKTKRSSSCARCAVRCKHRTRIKRWRQKEVANDGSAKRLMTR